MVEGVEIFGSAHGLSGGPADTTAARRALSAGTAAAGGMLMMLIVGVGLGVRHEYVVIHHARLLVGQRQE